MNAPEGQSDLESSGQPGLSRARVFIVDDHPVFREGLAQVLEREHELEVCGQAGDVTAALEAIGRLNPDLVVVDLSLPGKSGLDLIREVRVTNRKVKLLVVSMHDEALYADRVLRAGGDGYIMKEEDPEEILNAIQDVLAGRIYVSEEVLAGRDGGKPVEAHPPETPNPISKLTDVEVVILELLGQGKTNREIARDQDLSVSAIGAHCKELRKKLNLKNNNALIRYAVCWVEQGRS